MSNYDTKAMTETVWNTPAEYRITALPEQPIYDGMDKDLVAIVDKEINAGNLQCFTVRVDLRIHGIVLGTDFLGQCFFTGLQEFIDVSVNLSCMKAECRRQAYTNIMLLREIIIDCPVGGYNGN